MQNFQLQALTSTEHSGALLKDDLKVNTFTPTWRVSVIQSFSSNIKSTI